MSPFTLKESFVTVPRKIHIIKITEDLISESQGMEFAEKIKGILETEPKNVKYIIVDVNRHKVYADAGGGFVQVFHEIEKAGAVMVLCRIVPKKKECSIMTQFRGLFQIFNTLVDARSYIQKIRQY
jgi:hypothetical protein